MDGIVWRIRETDATGAHWVRNYTGRPMQFEEPMTPAVFAAALEHQGRTVEVVKIDLAVEVPLD